MLAVLLIVAAAIGAANVRQAPPDTVDVVVGSPVIDARDMRPFTSHIVVHRLAAGSSTFMAEKTNTMTRGDSAGIGLIRVDSRATVADERGTRSQVESHFTFDGRTLALRGLRVTQGSSELAVTTRGAEVSGRRTAGGATTLIALRLSAPAFHSQWADFVAEVLPRQPGVAYRVHLFSPEGTPAEEVHLFVSRGRADVEVLGKTLRNAWVVDDRTSDGKTLLGTMWFAQGPPGLIRWDVFLADSSVIHVEQEVRP